MSPDPSGKSPTPPLPRRRACAWIVTRPTQWLSSRLRTRDLMRALISGRDLCCHPAPPPSHSESTARGGTLRSTSWSRRSAPSRRASQRAWPPPSAAGRQACRRRRRSVAHVLRPTRYRTAWPSCLKTFASWTTRQDALINPLHPPPHHHPSPPPSYPPHLMHPSLLTPSPASPLHPHCYGPPVYVAAGGGAAAARRAGGGGRRVGV